MEPVDLNVSHELVEVLPARHVHPTTAMVGIVLDDLHVVGRSVLADDIELPANTAGARSTCGRTEPREVHAGHQSSLGLLVKVTLKNCSTYVVGIWDDFSDKDPPKNKTSLFLIICQP